MKNSTEYRIHHNYDSVMFKYYNTKTDVYQNESFGHYAGVWKDGLYGAVCTKNLTYLDDKNDMLLEVAESNAISSRREINSIQDLYDTEQCVPSFQQSDEFINLEPPLFLLEDYYEKLSALKFDVSYLDLRYTRSDKLLYFDECAYPEAYSRNILTIVLKNKDGFELDEKVVLHEGVNESHILKQVENLQKKIEFVNDKGYGPCPSGNWPCVLSPEATALITHEAIGHAMEADIAGKIEIIRTTDVLGIEKINIIDFAKGSFSNPAPVTMEVDDEGSICVDVDLVKDGKICNFMNDKSYAENLFSGRKTGNARAYYYRDVPMIRMRNTAFLPGDMDAEGLIESIDNGCYIDQVETGQADTGGYFCLKLKNGYRIRNGKICEPISGNMIYGNMVSFLRSITGISSEFRWVSDELCSKGQVVPVTMGGPYVSCSLSLL